MSDDEIKKLILSRRAKFIAAAVVGVIACEPQAQQPNVCLSTTAPPPQGDAGPYGYPYPTATDTGATTSDVPPQPCLSVTAPPATQAPPQPCLSPVPTPMPDAGSPNTPTAKDAGPPPMPCLTPPRPNN